MKPWMIIACLSVGIVCFLGCAETKSNRMSDAEMEEQVEDYNAEVEDPGDKIVCKVFRLTGSNMMRRVCLSQRDWDIKKHGAQEFVQGPRSSFEHPSSRK